MQAGLPHRDFDGRRFTGRMYLDLAAALKAAVPSAHLHAFSPEEVRMRRFARCIACRMLRATFCGLHVA